MQHEKAIRNKLTCERAIYEGEKACETGDGIIREDCLPDYAREGLAARKEDPSHAEAYC